SPAARRASRGRSGTSGYWAPPRTSSDSRRTSSSAWPAARGPPGRSRPRTPSPSRGSRQLRVALAPRRGLLVGVGGAQERGLVERTADQLQADGQAGGVEAARNRDG